MIVVPRDPSHFEKNHTSELESNQHDILNLNVDLYDCFLTSSASTSQDASDILLDTLDSDETQH